MLQRGFIAFLGSTDLETTHRFYTGLLGLTLAIDQGACRIYQVPGGGFIGFAQDPQGYTVEIQSFDKPEDAKHFQFIGQG